MGLTAVQEDRDSGNGDMGHAKRDEHVLPPGQIPQGKIKNR
jgi:hypothetical protein